jgi:hypothetical protein
MRCETEGSKGTLEDDREMRERMAAAGHAQDHSLSGFGSTCFVCDPISPDINLGTARSGPPASCICTDTESVCRQVCYAVFLAKDRERVPSGA